MAGSASAQDARSDAALLSEEVMPGFRVLADDGIARVLEPYVVCYATAVETSAGSALRDDRAVRAAEQVAQQRCATIKAMAMRQADTTLADRAPDSTPMARAAMLRSARRQAALFALIARYRDQIRGAVFQRYLERIGSAARRGRPVARLSDE